MLTVYLKMRFFTFKDAPHLPPNTAAVSGSDPEWSNGGVTMTTEQYFNEDGKQLDGKSVRLFIPTSKIDHAITE